MALGASYLLKHLWLSRSLKKSAWRTCSRMDTWDSSTSATTGLVDEPMVQSQLYSFGAKAVPCAAVTACHDKAKVWYLCYTVVSLPMECWLKKASLKYCRHWVWQQSSITIIFSTVHCLERGLPRQLTRDPVISWQGISAVRVEKQGWGLSKCIRTYNKVAFDTKIPLLFLTFVISIHANIGEKYPQILDLFRYVQ